MMYSRYSLLIMLAIGMAGCLPVTPRSLFELARFDLMTVNPADLGAGIGVPSDIVLTDGGAHLRLIFGLQGETQPRVDETLTLRILTAVQIAGAPQALPGEVIYLAALSDESVLRMRDAQRRILALKKTGANGSGSLSVALRKVCSQAGAPRALPLRTFLRTSRNGSFIALTGQSDLLKSLSQTDRDALLAGISVCDAQPTQNGAA